MSSRGRWPLLVLAAPASVAIWSGWVSLGEMCGFGTVHPLPGIADGWQINSAITLPIGMEAYAAYALGAWLSPKPIRRQARRFARWSSMVALAVGVLGQAVYHLLNAWGFRTAPMAVVVGVACLPVLVLAAGATLHHLIGEDRANADRAPVHDSGRPVRRLSALVRSWRADWSAGAGTAPDRSSGGPVQDGRPSGPVRDRSELPVRPRLALSGPTSDPTPNFQAPARRALDVSELVEPARAVVAELTEDGQPLNRATLRKGLRKRGLTCANEKVGPLLRALRGEALEEVS
ncbi:MAG: hypothetical protein J2P20_00090 [Pseudonocardia sp.]|nr:hypothetical protein [Pseudonocardia sp.]